MMLPLCTSVTDSRPLSIAYWIAMRTSRFEPKAEIGLMPMPAPSKNFAPISLRRKLATFSFSGVPDLYSMPAYTSSVFSRKITTSTLPGVFSGEGTPA